MPGSSARQRTRAAVTRDILDTAHAHVARDGAQQLSLRAVARDLGVASSALYRYFPSRHDLLTALIVDAYTSLADHLDGIADTVLRPRDGEPSAWYADSRAPSERRTSGVRAWTAVCEGMRAWARDHPHEFALAYGTPVPGYTAAEATRDAATRVFAIPVEVVRRYGGPDPRTAPGYGFVGDTGGSAAPDPGRLLHVSADPGPHVVLPAGLYRQLRGIDISADHGIPPDLMARLLYAWTQVFGVLSAELFGHLRGTVEPADAFFDYAVLLGAFVLGLTQSTTPERRFGP